MFEINNGVSKIDGSKGIYDKTVSDPSIRYGRNAVENYYTYLEQPIVNDSFNPAPILDFGISPDAPERNAQKLEKFINENEKYYNSLPPLEYEYRYMPKLPKGEIDKKAVLGAAYEEMGAVKERSVSELDAGFAPNTSFSSKVLDINNDDKIDIAEYGSSILAADMLSKDEKPDFNNIDGTINDKGQNAILAYAHKSNAEAATKLYANIYNTYKLNEGLNEFSAE